MPTTREPSSGEQIELTHGDHRVVVVTAGGGLRRYRLGDWEVLDGYAEDDFATAARGAVLIPWPNRLRDGRYAFAGEELQLPITEPSKNTAIHGLVRWAEWEATERAAGRVVMRHVLRPRDGWPFTLRLAIEYALADDGLTVRTTATNAGARACPYGAGTHPYLTVGTPTIDAAVLRAPGSRRMVLDDQGIPIGDEPVDGTPCDFRTPRPIGDTELDTGYADLERGGDGLARVEMSAPDDGPSVVLWLDEGYPFLMLFTGDSLDEGARRRGLGVEPMTCAPNALASGDGLRTLEPGEPFTAAWGISPRA